MEAVLGVDPIVQDNLRDEGFEPDLLNTDLRAK